MGLFKRSSGVRVSVTPEVVRPRQTVQATVTTDKPVDKVSAVTLEWGYTNFYRYRWAGRADAAATAGVDSWVMMDQVGTDAGSEKDTEDWVGVTKVDLPVGTGEFSGGSASFTVPSWAPGSSDALARWSARLTIERGGRDIDTRGDFAVIIGSDDIEVADAGRHVVAGHHVEQRAARRGLGRDSIQVVVNAVFGGAKQAAIAAGRQYAFHS